MSSANSELASGETASGELRAGGAQEDLPEAEPFLLEELPFECLVECLAGLSNAKELAACMLVSKTLFEAASTDVLWRNLCVAGQHGASLDFQQDVLGSFGHPDARDPNDQEPVVPGQTAWKEVYRNSCEAMQTTICIDTGRGYAKYGLADWRRPRPIQICQPGAEATQESVYPVAFRLLNLRRADISAYAAIVSEPFRLASYQCDRERAAWRYETERRILQGFQLKQVCIVDSASLCLFAHNLTSGVVVNIGFANTFVVPVLRGHVIRKAVRVMRLGGAGLTQFFAQLCEMRDVEVRAPWPRARPGHALATPRYLGPEPEPDPNTQRFPVRPCATPRSPS